MREALSFVKNTNKATPRRKFAYPMFSKAGLWSTKARPQAVKLGFLKQAQNSQTASKAAKLNTARAAQNSALIGNRLSLIHKHLTSSRILSDQYNKRSLEAAYIRKMQQITQGLGFAHSALPA